MSHESIDVDFDPAKIVITDENLKELLGKFTPLIKGDDGRVWRIEPVDPRQISFTYAPALVEVVEVEEVRTLTTDHDCGYWGLFKPSASEVLAQVFDDGSDWGDAFYIDTSFIQIFKDGEGHRATTHFVRIVK